MRNREFNKAFAQARMMVRDKLHERSITENIEEILDRKQTLVTELAHKIMEKKSKSVNELFEEKFGSLKKKASEKEADKKRGKCPSIKQFNSFDSLPEHSEYEALVKKSNKSGVPVETLAEVYDRGIESWNEEIHITPQQYAFARVNSYINKGKTYYEEDLDLHEHIEKVANGYRLVSKKTGKNLGTYSTLSGAKKREGQVEYFKHINEATDYRVTKKGKTSNVFHSRKGLVGVIVDDEGTFKTSTRSGDVSSHKNRKAAIDHIIYKHMKEDVEQIDEISKPGLKNYIIHASKDVKNKLKNANSDKDYDKIYNRENNINNASEKYDGKLAAYKPKAVSGLYSYNHREHPDGSFVQRRIDGRGPYIHFDSKTGKQTKHDSYEGLVKHINEGVVSVVKNSVNTFKHYYPTKTEVEKPKNIVSPEFKDKVKNILKPKSKNDYYGQQDEEVDLIEAKSGNPLFGYHGYNSGKTDEEKAKNYSGMHRKLKGLFTTSGDIKTEKHPNVVIKHFLDSSHGRDLVDIKDDRDMVTKFRQFKKTYNPRLFEEVDLTETRGNPYVKPLMDDSNPTRQRGWKSSNGHHVKFWQMHAKESAHKHAGIPMEEAVNEMTNKKLIDYIGKAGSDYFSGENKHKRAKGIESAARKLAYRQGVKESITEGLYKKGQMLWLKNRTHESTPANGFVYQETENHVILKAGPTGKRLYKAKKDNVSTELKDAYISSKSLKEDNIEEGYTISSAGYGKVHLKKSGKIIKTFSDPRDAKMYISKIEVHSTDKSKPESRFDASDELVDIYKKDTPGETNRKFSKAFVKEGKMKELEHDLENLDAGNFKKKYSKTKNDMRISLRPVGGKPVLKEDVKAGDRHAVIIPSYIDQNGNTIPARTEWVKTGKKIIKSGNVHDGKIGT